MNTKVTHTTQSHDPAVLQEIDMQPGEVKIIDYKKPEDQPPPLSADVQPSGNSVVDAAMSRAFADAQTRFSRRRK